MAVRAAVAAARRHQPLLWPAARAFSSRAGSRCAAMIPALTPWRLCSRRLPATTPTAIRHWSTFVYAVAEDHNACAGGLGKVAAAAATQNAVGFAGIRGLVTPADFGRMAIAAEEDTKALLAGIKRAGVPRSAQATRRLVASMDRISDAVCAIADVASFCRAVHSSEEWRVAAHAAVERLSDTVIAVNADQELFAILQGALSTGTAAAAADGSVSAEELRMLRDLLLDMESAGLGSHLQEAEMQEMSRLHAHVGRIKHACVRACVRACAFVRVCVRVYVRACVRACARRARACPLCGQHHLVACDQRRVPGGAQRFCLRCFCVCSCAFIS